MVISTKYENLGLSQILTVKYPKVCVIIPAFNEEEAIERTIKSIPQKQLLEIGYEVNILVADNGSTDKTRELAQKAGAEIVIETARGKGNAFRNGLKYVDADFIFMIDGDSTYPANYIPKMLRQLEYHDVVIASRFRKKIHKSCMNRLNYLGNCLLSRMASILYRKKISDVCSGLWGFRAEVVTSLGLKSRGFELEAELFSKIVKKNLSFHEVAIPYAPRTSPSKLRVLKDGMKISYTLISMLWS
jgi:glycosyltransferase involved in cell wall biosynthesis